MKPVRVRPVADRDLDDHADYIAMDNLHAALRFLDAVEGAYERIGAFPDIGSPRFAHLQLLRNLRVWPVLDFENYFVFYFVRPTYVDVVRVLHGARNIPAVLRNTLSE